MKLLRARRFLTAVWLLPFAFLTALPAEKPNAATLSYRRIFNATFEIRQLDEDASPTPFEVGAPLRARMFELAEQLHHFENVQLDVRRRIANLGEKTFRYEEGKEAHETKFNYTLNGPANQLMQIFEGLARQQEHVVTLERRMKYDRLGVNDALLQFETDLNRKLLPEPQRVVPVLDEIANNPRFVDIARQRARALAERIRDQS